MANSILQNQEQAIRYFITPRDQSQKSIAKANAWKKVLFEAPAIAMERIAISMFYAYFKKALSKEELDQYRALRGEIDKTLRREDLEYLIKVMPQKQKKYYEALLSLLPPETAAEAQQPLPQQEPSAGAQAPESIPAGMTQPQAATEPPAASAQQAQ